MANLDSQAWRLKMYVRYENSSWKYGDASDNSGIIYSHLE